MSSSSFPSGQTIPGGLTGTMPSGGLVRNGSTFEFLFCTEDGTITGITASQPVSTTILVDNSKSGAVYKGCTYRDTPETGTTDGVGVPFFYAANFGSRSIEVWDVKLNPVRNPAAFVNPAIPAGFAPFNIQSINGQLYVTCARQDAANRNDVPAAGNGYVAAFDLSSRMLSNLVAQGPLNSPWGLTIAPAMFADFANALPVGNSGDRRINAFDPATGAWKARR